jgi:hypothetical protein
VPPHTGASPRGHGVWVPDRRSLALTCPGRRGVSFELKLLIARRCASACLRRDASAAYCADRCARMAEYAALFRPTSYELYEIRRGMNSNGWVSLPPSLRELRRRSRSTHTTTSTPRHRCKSLEYTQRAITLPIPNVTVSVAGKTQSQAVFKEL